MKALKDSLPAVEDFAANGQHKLSDPKAEERIIASLMGIPSVAWPQVKDALTADDFSSEQWRLIYRAAVSPISAGTPVDSISIEHQLRRLGKYDAAGGDAVVSTVGLQYEEEISHYRDIVVALSIKRQAISRFEQFIDKAKTGQVDIGELIDEAAKDLQHFAENASPRTQEVKMQEVASKLLVVERPEAIAPLVMIDQTPVVRRGDHTLVVGKEKSRKSLFISHLISDYLRKNPGSGKRVKVFDTEQDRDDVWLARERIRRATTETVDFYNMRGMHPKARRDFISWVVADGETHFIVIDGIRDCMSNIIDADETTEVIVWLEDMTVRRRLAIIDVLHLNKTDGNARGHIGTELSNKALATIEISYNDQTTLSEVKCRTARKKPFEPFCFTHSIDGQYQDMGVPMAPVQGLAAADAMPKTQKQQHMDAIFEGGSINYKALRDKVSIEFGVGSRRAEQLIAKFTREGLFIKNGKAGEKETIYKLNPSPIIDPTHQGPVTEPLPAPLFEPPLADGHQPTEDLPF